mgnify:CR=1 FL=1
MAYSFSGRVRYSEIGENGLLTLPGILNYFQDCSTFHSEAAGLGVKVLKEKNKFWVLSAWQVIVNRYPYLGEEIVTSTWPYGFRGFMGFRNFTMDTAEGERLAYANTFWTFIDGKNGLPCKLSAEYTEGYGLEEKLDAMVRHELYVKYKTAPTEEEREQARLEYLDRRGVSKSFRW